MARMLRFRRSLALQVICASAGAKPLISPRRCGLYDPDVELPSFADLAWNKLRVGAFSRLHNQPTHVKRTHKSFREPARRHRCTRRRQRIIHIQLAQSMAEV